MLTGLISLIVLVKKFTITYRFIKLNQSSNVFKFIIISAMIALATINRGVTNCQEWAPFRDLLSIRAWKEHWLDLRRTWNLDSNQLFSQRARCLDTLHIILQILFFLFLTRSKQLTNPIFHILYLKMMFIIINCQTAVKWFYEIQLSRYDDSCLKRHDAGVS